MAEQVSHHPPGIIILLLNIVISMLVYISVSALYAECPAKRMYAFGSIQSKSRFLGLSVGIQNIGQCECMYLCVFVHARVHTHVCVYLIFCVIAIYPITVRMVLMEHNEEYIATLPSAYGRSILTVPWVELGGKCVIDCPQTGYSAHIEFHCKVSILPYKPLQHLVSCFSLDMEVRDIVLLRTFDE